MFFVPFIAVALLAAWLRGGRISRIATCEVTGLACPVASFFVEVLRSLLWVPLRRWGWADGLLVCAQYALLAVFLVRNWRYCLGVPVAALGTLLNFVVIACNGFLMPVTARVAALPGWEGVVARLVAGEEAGYVLAGAHTRLGFLGDVLLVDVGPLRGLASVGDVLLALGIAWLLYCAMRREVRPTKEADA